MSDPAVLRHVRAGTTEESAPITVPFVTMPDGARTERASDICADFASHFSELFTSESWLHLTENFTERVQDLCGDLPRVAEGLHEQLCAPATSEELQKKLKAMNAASGPGPDLIPINFYCTFFGAIKSALLEMVNGFLIDGLWPTSFCECRIVLILKADGD